MSRFVRPLALLTGALLLLTAAACGSDDDSSGSSASASASGSASGSASAPASGSGSASAPADGDLAFAEDDADVVVHVSATEYEFTFDTAPITGPKVFFEVANEGEEEHEFEVLDADGEAIDEIPAFEPGEEKAIALELDPGTYTVQCLVELDDGTTHADEGMTTEIEVAS